MDSKPEEVANGRPTHTHRANQQLTDGMDVQSLWTKSGDYDYNYDQVASIGWVDDMANDMRRIDEISLDSAKRCYINVA